MTDVGLDDLIKQDREKNREKFRVFYKLFRDHSAVEDIQEGEDQMIDSMIDQETTTNDLKTIVLDSKLSLFERITIGSKIEEKKMVTRQSKNLNLKENMCENRKEAQVVRIKKISLLEH
jgi:hypothetical protein